MTFKGRFAIAFVAGVLLFGCLGGSGNSVGVNLGGKNSSKVVVTEFSDFQCPFCKRVVPTLEKAIESYGDKVLFVYKTFPLIQIHPFSMRAAEAFMCADEQGKAKVYHDALFLNQDDLSDPMLLKYAKDSGLDTTKLQECLSSGRTAARVQAMLDEGTNLGITGTPTMFVGTPGNLYDQRLEGAVSYETLQQVIDTELLKAG